MEIGDKFTVQTRYRKRTFGRLRGVRLGGFAMSDLVFGFSRAAVSDWGGFAVSGGFVVSGGFALSDLVFWFLNGGGVRLGNPDAIR
jgi:hypothetical protein